MAKTPENHVLSSKLAATGIPPSPEGPPPSTTYPRMLVHKDSKPGALITKEVQTAEELAALGDEWGSLADLGIETAPAAKEP